MKIFAILFIIKLFLGEFTANLKDSYSLSYSPMCESSSLHSNRVDCHANVWMLEAYD